MSVMIAPWDAKISRTCFSSLILFNPSCVIYPRDPCSTTSPGIADSPGDSSPSDEGSNIAKDLLRILSGVDDGFSLMMLTVKVVSIKKKKKSEWQIQCIIKHTLVYHVYTTSSIVDKSKWQQARTIEHSGGFKSQQCHQLLTAPPPKKIVIRAPTKTKKKKEKSHKQLCFSLFETTEICFGSTEVEISTGKKHFTPGKKRHWRAPP